MRFLESRVNAMLEVWGSDRDPDVVATGAAQRRHPSEALAETEALDHQRLQ
jgi:hypothetical protein